MQDRELQQAAYRPGFQLKGSGWYATDFKGGGCKTESKSDNPPPCQGGTGSCAANP
jgi:predicted nucleic acid-binding Zn ribbon protein